jgi:hypothetical protein
MKGNYIHTEFSNKCLSLQRIMATDSNKITAQWYTQININIKSCDHFTLSYKWKKNGSKTRNHNAFSFNPLKQTGNYICHLL